MTLPPRFAVDASEARLVVCDHRPVRRASDLGAPGLWREVRTATGTRNVFEIPEPGRLGVRLTFPAAPRGPARAIARLMRRMDVLGAVARDEVVRAPTTPRVEAEREPEGCSLADLVRWAEATADGRPARLALAGWTPPPDLGAFGSLLHSFALDEGRSRGRPWSAWGALVVESRRVALEYRDLLRLPAELPAARRAWAAEVCRDACTRWTFVRVGLRPDHGAGGVQRGEFVAAEVDLTGAPPALLPCLLHEGREALASVVQDLRPTLAVLADRRLESRLLARRPLAERVVRSTPGTVPGANPTRYFQLSFPW